MVTPTDPNYPGQWYLQPGTGLDFRRIWDDWRGAGVTIGVVDTGFNHAHAEFGTRVDRTRDYDAVQKDADASATGDDPHGTEVALLLAAGMNNGGRVGAAPEATLVGFRMGSVSTRTPAQEIDLLGRQAAVDISHNSWSYSGQPFRDDFAGATFAAAGEAIRDAAATGRGGLGTVFVRSAGNYRAQGDDLGAHNYGNNRFSIAVGSVDSGGTVQPFSNPGAALLLSAPGGATSWSAPLVSGTVALMLQANPGLGWRDVQDILALTARPTDIWRSGWLTNAAGDWNGGGMQFSRDYGHGIVDPRAAVRLAETWTARSTSANELVRSGSAAPGLAIPDGDAAGVESTIAIAGAIVLDRAEVTLDIPHARAGDLQVSLVSPSGTSVLLYDRIGGGGTAEPLRFTTSAEAFRGEAGEGAWRLVVVDAAAGGTGTLAGWTLRLTGDAPSADSNHVYTDAFQWLGKEPGRATLADTAGH
ncbi:MAG TPA: S8 family serine peptidase, partial [Azospirillaceae bacterium]|nr:S8 family serine peptidase [Azospirillaceae bacterium]